MKEIDFQVIEQEYKRALENCAAVFPLSEWQHQPLGLEITPHKTKYGMASNSGKVFISQIFFGTQAYGKLRNTLRHELAHLAAGVRHGHNAVFKQFENLFCARQPVNSEELKEIDARIGYKWRLIAHLHDGSSHVLGYYHR